jgi:small-conductance mechanosensitive channel
MADSVVLGAVPVLQSLSGTDERLVASALLVVGAVVVAALFAPAAVRWTRRFIAHRFLGGRLATAADEVTERFPLTTPVRLVLRGLQATVLVTTSVALLAVWNRTDAALTVLSAVQVSPVIVGDDQEGVVTDITIISTRLENFDGEFIVMPNDKVADSPVTNKSQKGRLRLRVDVGIDYDADPERAEVVALEAIRTVGTVTETPPPKVFPKSFGDSGVVLEMRFWIERPTPPKKWRTQAAVVNAVKDAFDREGIKIPYPQRELSGRAETGGFRVADEQRAEAERYPDGHGPRG